jgi:aminoglycoside phosphotransferase (APT) family kinase protein
MNRVPVHPGLRPEPLKFARSGDALEAAIARQLGSALAEILSSSTHTGDLRYLRLELDGQPVFGKWVPEEDSRSVEAARLGDALAAKGVRTPSLLQPPVHVAGGQLLLWPWVEGRFATGSDAEMDTLGGHVARLHHALREWDRECPAAQPAEPERSRWQQLGMLASSRRLGASTQAALDGLLDRAAEVEARLQLAAQTVHDDLHPGNVLFDAGGEVAALLDFEEALSSRATPWFDLAWVIERFCLAAQPPDRAELAARRFLAAYLARADGLPVLEGILQAVMEWRNLRALAVLQAGPPVDGAPERRAEWDKFERLVALAGSSHEMLRRLEAFAAR